MFRRAYNVCFREASRSISRYNGGQFGPSLFRLARCAITEPALTYT